jgi:hypothetical protein
MLNATDEEKIADCSTQEGEGYSVWPTPQERDDCTSDGDDSRTGGEGEQPLLTG